MVLLVVVVVFTAAIAALSQLFRRQPNRRRLWRMTLRIGLGLGVMRAALASLGWYVVEHNGGPLQIPAFALAMLAWPEAAIFTERRFTPVPPAFYISLSLLLVTSTVVLVGLLAVASNRTRQ
jgi:hypothetical protein